MAADKETREIEIVLNAQQANASLKQLAAAQALMNNQLAKMAQDDPRRAQLMADFQEIKARVKAARDEINGYVKSEEQLRAETEKVTQANTESVASGQQATASMRQMKDAAGLLYAQLEELSADDPGRAKLIADYQALQQRMAAARAEVTTLTKSEEQLRAETEHLNQANAQTIATGKLTTASLQQMKDAAGLLEKQLALVSKDDPGRKQLIADYQALKGRISDNVTEMNTYVQTEEELRAETEKFNQEQQEIILNGQRVTASFREMKESAGVLEKQLAEISADDPGRGKLIADYQALEHRIEAVKNELKGAAEGGSFFKKALTFSGINLGVETLVDGIKDLARSSVEAAKKGSDSIADMEKSLNVTTAEAHALRTELESIDTRTGQEELEKIAVAGGQLGITADQIRDFTVAADQAVVALGDEFSGGVEEVTKSLGSLQKVFKQTQDMSPAEALTRIGSAVNALGAEGLASGPNIAEFASRIGQLGNQAPAITETLGLGAAFEELNLNAQIAAGGLTNVLQTGAKETAAFAKQIGITEQEFTDLINSDPNEMILRLADSFKGASNTEITQTLAGMKVTSQEATKVMAQLADKTDLVREKQKLAAVEFAKGTSLYEEYLKKNTNAAAEMDKAEKKWASFRRELGEYLIPVYIRANQLAGEMLDILMGLPRFVKENQELFVALGVAIVALNAANIKSTVTTLAHIAAEKARAAATRATTVALWLLDAAAAANPLGIMVAAGALLVAMFVRLYNNSETFRAGLAGLANVARTVFTNIKEIALSTLGGLGNLIAGVFSGNLKMIKDGIAQLSGVGSQVAAAYHQGYQKQQDLEHAKDKDQQAAHDSARKDQAGAAGKKEGEAHGKSKADATAKAHLAELQAEEAQIRRRLALVQKGSAEELKLKQQLAAVLAQEKAAKPKTTAAGADAALAAGDQKQHELAEAFAQKQQAKREKALREAQALQNKADQARLDEIKLWVRQEEQMEDARILAINNKREREIAKINLDAKRKGQALVTEGAQLTIDLEGIEEERQRKLQALDEKLFEERQKKNKELLEEKLAQEDEAEAERETAIQDKFADMLLTEFERDQLLYEQKKASLEAKLALEEAYGLENSTLALRTHKQLEKLEQQHDKQVHANALARAKAKKQFAQLEIQTASDALGLTIELLSRDEAARKRNAGIIKAFSIAKLTVDGAEEIAGIWKDSATNKYWDLLPPWARIAWAVGRTAITAGRTGVAISQVKAQQFAEGGATGGGMLAAAGTMLQSSGMRVGSNGKLIDDTGFAVAGVVHEDEYVIPKWMRQDPQVLQVEQWLEARRLRGYAEGGATSDGGSQVPVATSGDTAGVLGEVRDVLRGLNQRLQAVETWASSLEVVQHTGELVDELESVKKVRQRSRIGGK